MWWKSGIAVALILALGCATTSEDILPPEADLLPPAFHIETARDRQDLDYFLLKMASGQPRPNVQWWVDYRRAKLWQDTDPKLSCDLYTRLIQEEKFPLRSLAILRQHEVCSVGTSTDWAEMKFPAWLQPVRNAAELSEAKRNGNLPQEFDLLIEQGKVSAIVEEKLDLTEEALRLAENLKDKERIEIALERREKIAPRFERQPSHQKWLAMAHDFRRARQFETARTYYRKVIERKKEPFHQRLSAWRGLAQTFKTEGKKQNHVDALKGIVNLTKPPKKTKATAAWRTHQDAIINLARAEWTNGRSDTAQELLEKSLKTFNKRISRAEMFWILGRIHEERGQIEPAIDRFNQAESEVEPKSELSEKLDWYLAWNLRKLQRWPDAVAAFERGRDRTINDFSKARFHYWLGRSLMDSKEDSRAETEFKSLIEFDPLGYYGLLAQHDLKQPIKKITRSKAVPSGRSQIRHYIDFPIFDWLIAVDEKDLARGLLDVAALALKKSGHDEKDEATWTDLLHAYARTGSYLQLYERLGKMDPVQRQNILTHNPDLLFPQPWLADVKSAAEKTSVPPELLFAIMRQESSFNPRARSNADAFGLMQLLPEVAERAASKVSVPFAKPEDLYEPEVNIPIGAYHIRELMDKFKGQFIPAVASYNASENSIRNWIQVRYKGDAVEFIEEIPYEETRGYIRLVMRNLIFYQLLNSSNGEIDFPEWVLKLSPAG